VALILLGLVAAQSLGEYEDVESNGKVGVPYG